MKNRSSLAVFVLLMVAISGCISGETDPRPGTGDISIHFNDGTFEETSFIVNATIEFRLHIEEGVVFDHVMFCLYDQQGQVLNATDIGSFTTPVDSATTTISADSRPSVIVADHPRFDDYPTIGPAILAWNSEEEYFAPRDSEDLPFDYPTSDDIGTCR